MSWNFKMSEADLAAHFTVICQRVDTVVGDKMRKYFEIFEAGNLENIFGRLNAADRTHTETQDYEALAAALDKYREEMEAAAERVSQPLKNSEKARIHILKAESGVSEEKYRELIQRIGSVSSSRHLVYWQGMILIRALTRIKERKHGQKMPEV